MAAYTCYHRTRSFLPGSYTSSSLPRGTETILSSSFLTNCLNGLNQTLSELIQQIMRPLSQSHILLYQSQILDLQIFKVLSTRRPLFASVDDVHEIVLVHVRNVSSLPLPHRLPLRCSRFLKLKLLFLNDGRTRRLILKSAHQQLPRFCLHGSVEVIL